MKCTEMTLPGVMLFEPDVFGDQRGFFLETFNKAKYADAGLDVTFLQDNHSRSVRGTLRGLHYQLTHPQGKLVYVVRGEIFDVAVDIRRNSPTFGKWLGQHLSETNKHQLYIPPGFAHGFCVISDVADVLYKCTDLFTPGDDYGILWSDEDIGIEWPIDQPILSEKDAKNPILAKAPEDILPI